jgi:hypothetical protein
VGGEILSFVVIQSEESATMPEDFAERSLIERMAVDERTMELETRF